MIKRESKATNKTSVNSVIGFGHHRKQMENAETFLETLGKKKKKHPLLNWKGFYDAGLRSQMKQTVSGKHNCL